MKKKPSRVEVLLQDPEVAKYVEREIERRVEVALDKRDWTNRTRSSSRKKDQGNDSDACVVITQDELLRFFEISCTSFGRLFAHLRDFDLIKAIIVYLYERTPNSVKEIAKIENLKAEIRGQFVVKAVNYGNTVCVRRIEAEDTIQRYRNDLTVRTLEEKRFKQ